MTITEAAKIAFRCSGCRAKLQAAPGMARKISRCPACRSFVRIGPGPRDPAFDIGSLRSVVLMNASVADGSSESSSVTGLLTATDFQVGSLLGTGRFSSVFHARQKSTGREVALKILRIRDTAPNRLVRLCMEAEVLQRLWHPNIVQGFGVGFYGINCWMAMEYLDGGSIEDRCKQDPVPWTVAALWLRQSLAGLRAAHQVGIVHRDIKPENLLLTKQGRVCISDFGLIKVLECDMELTREGAVVGSPAFLAPETITAGQCDSRSDLYGLGATFYRVLTGRLPFPHDGMQDLLWRVANTLPEPIRNFAPAVPPAFCRIIERMMERSPERRYQTALDVITDVKELATV